MSTRTILRREARRRKQSPTTVTPSTDQPSTFYGDLSWREICERNSTPYFSDPKWRPKIPNNDGGNLEPGRCYIFLQTSDRLFSVCFDDVIEGRLSKTINTVIKFAEWDWPIGGAVENVNGELWIMGGEKHRSNIYYPPGFVRRQGDSEFVYGKESACFCTIRLITKDPCNRHVLWPKLLKDKFLKVAKPRPICEIFDNKLYLLPGISNAAGGVDAEHAFEVYDLASETWKTLPPPPGITHYYEYKHGLKPFNHFVVGKKLFIYTGGNFICFDTRTEKWSSADDKLAESFNAYMYPKPLQSSPMSGKYLKLGDMHIVFGYNMDTGFPSPFAYLFSVSDDLDSDEVYLRCFQRLYLHNPRPDDSLSFPGVFIPLGGDRMCAADTYFRPGGLVVRLVIFSVSLCDYDDELSEYIEIWRSEHPSEIDEPIHHFFLDVKILDSMEYPTGKINMPYHLSRATILNT